jgi:hypothetical protein
MSHYPSCTSLQSSPAKHNNKTVKKRNEGDNKDITKHGKSKKMCDNKQNIITTNKEI